MKESQVETKEIRTIIHQPGQYNEMLERSSSALDETLKKTFLLIRIVQHPP